MDPSPNPTPRVTALLPTHNGEKLIGGMLHSLAQQTYGNLCILISDDCSTDRTADLCRAFAADRQDTTLFVQERNLGWVGNSNYLLDAAGGEYVFFAFHDDELAPTYVEELVSALLADSSASVAFSDLLLSKDGHEPVEMSFDALSGIDSAAARAKIMLCRPGTSWISFRGLTRRRTANEIGGLKKHWLGERSADWIFGLALSLRGSFVRVPKALYTKNKRVGGVAASWSRSVFMRLTILSMGLREVFRSPLPIPDRVSIAGVALIHKGRALLTRGGGDQ